MGKRRKQSVPYVRCPTCGARILLGDATCPICEAQVLTITEPRFGWYFPHMLMGLGLTLLVLVAFLWYIQPTLGMAAVPTATLAATRTPWPTMTYTDTPTVTLTPTATRTATPTPYCVDHIVEANESLGLVSEKFGVSIEAIRRHNMMAEAERITPGQRICIPFAPEKVGSLTPLPTSTPTPLTYAVSRGDNLGSIAEQFDTTVALLVEANDLDEGEMLSIGQSLIIPRIFDTPTPVPPTWTPTRTVPRPTVTPTHTETPRSWAYAPPVLLYPPEGADFHGEDAQILLNWAAVTLLGADEWYILTLAYLEDGERRPMLTIRTKDTSWRMPKTEYRIRAGFHTIEWRVILVRETLSGERIGASPPGEPGIFYWY